MRLSRMQVTGICLAALLVVFAIGVRAQDQQAPNTPGPTDSQKALGVYFVRALTDAEMAFQNGDEGKGVPKMNRFGSLEELQKAGLVTTVKTYDGHDYSNPTEVLVSTGDQTVPGYHLDLLVSGDGQSFDAALRDTNKADHGFMVYIDNHGVIYFGQPLQ